MSFSPRILNVAIGAMRRHCRMSAITASFLGSIVTDGIIGIIVGRRSARHRFPCFHRQ
jgi:hypothetical protein